MSTDIDYDNPWLYNKKPFTSADIGDNFGFVYLITNKLQQSKINYGIN